MAVHCAPKATEPAVPAPATLLLTPCLSVEERRLRYTEVVILQSQPSFARPSQPGPSGLSNVRLGNMLVLQKHAPQSVTRPATSTAAAQGAPSLGQVSMAMEEASPSQGEPTLVSATPTLGSADPGPTVCSMMVHLTQMVDLLLAGPLAPLCREEVLELHKLFTDPAPSKQ